jgi:hypothetical protein
MNYNYYYNTVPEIGKVRNNLVYTSLISDDQKVFVKWFYNDSDYHKGKNEVIDPALMESRWQRELRYMTLMNDFYPEHIPKILDIDHTNKKIYLEIDGVDFWQRHFDANCSYEDVLPDWKEQMTNIIQSHKNLGLFKYSLHPSSYFIVDGQLKSINYFFSYHTDEPLVQLKEFKTHISEDRREKLEGIMKQINLTWDTVVPFKEMQLLAFESFKSNYPETFIEEIKKIYVS